MTSASTGSSRPAGPDPASSLLSPGRYGFRMRLLFLGDVVGRAGRKAVVESLPDLIKRWKLDFVVVNAENAAGGFGITEEIMQDLLDAGADV